MKFSAECVASAPQVLIIAQTRGTTISSELAQLDSNSHIWLAVLAIAF
jgi:hypothetical protein